DQRPRPGGHDERPDRAVAPARRDPRAARRRGARHLSSGRGGLLRYGASRGGSPDPLAALAREALRPYYLLHGEETVLVDRAFGGRRGRLLPPERPGTWRTLWADQEVERLGDALAELASPPLFGGPQVLVVRHAEALRDDDQGCVLDALPTLG